MEKTQLEHLAFLLASQQRCMEASAKPKFPSQITGMSNKSCFSQSVRSARLSQRARSCSTMIAMIFPVHWTVGHRSLTAETSANTIGSWV